MVSRLAGELYFRLFQAPSPSRVCISVPSLCLGQRGGDPRSVSGSRSVPYAAPGISEVSNFFVIFSICLATARSGRPVYITELHCQVNHTPIFRWGEGERIARSKQYRTGTEQRFGFINTQFPMLAFCCSALCLFLPPTLTSVSTFPRL